MAQTIESVSIRGASGPGADQTYSTATDDDELEVVFRYTGEIQEPNGWKAQVQVGTKVGETRSCTRDNANTALLTCVYQVVDGDFDADGVSVGANSIIATGGDSLSRIHRALPDQSGHKVDGVGLGIVSISLDSSPGADGAYVKDDLIEMTVTFTEPVQLVGNFAPKIKGTASRMTRRQAALPATSLTYTYKVVSDDNSPRIGLDSFAESQLTIEDRAGNDGLFASGGVTSLDVAKVAITGGAAQRIDTAAPTIVTTRRASTDEDKYGQNDKVNVVVEFSEPVVVTGAPVLQINAGTGTESAKLLAYRSGSGTRELTYQWTVPAGVGGTGGDATESLTVPQNPHRLGSGTIKDAAGNNATLDASEINNTAFGGMVDSRAPEVTGNVVRNCGGSIQIGSGCTFAVTFDELLDVSSESSITLGFRIGTSSRTARYLSKSDNNSQTTLTFSYTFTRSDMPAATTDADLDIGVPENGLGSGGSIADKSGNKANRKHAALAAESIDVPDVTQGGNERDDTTVPTVTDTAVEVLGGRTSGSKVLFGRGSTIRLAVTFSEDVTYSGTVELPLTVGTKSAKARASSTSGRRIVFQYSVKNDDVGTVTLGSQIEGATSASIKDKASPSNALDFDSANVTSWSGTTVEVDTTGPKVSLVTVTSNTDSPNGELNEADGKRYYGAGSQITVTVTMAEPNNVIVESATLALGIGSTSRLAAYVGNKTEVSASGAVALRFRYRVASADEDIDGISIAKSALRGTMKDAAGNSADLDLGAQAKTNLGAHPVLGSLGAFVPVDQGTTDPTTTPPPDAIDRVTASTSGTPTNGFYKNGATITFTLSFKEPGVDITAAPALQLDVGGTARTARCSGTGTARRSITCSYTVQSGDEDANGISVSGLSGGSMKVGERDISRSLPTVSGLPKVDANVPTVARVEITSSAGADGTYSVGNPIRVTVTFSEPVRRQGTADPSLPILVGAVTRTATLQTPSSTAGLTATWVFQYTVQAGDTDSNGVSIAANALSGALEDEAENAATITHAEVPGNTSHKVDTQGPRVTAVAVSGANDDNLFLEGTTIRATVTFDEEVDVATTGTNAVKVRFNIGSSQRTATYAGGDNTKTLTFTYEVVAGDSGAISLPANALDGEAEDAAGNPAGSTPAVPVTPYVVDASAPMLVGAPTITSSAGDDDTYVAGDAITVQVRFDEAVKVTGTPRIHLAVGERRRFASYTPGTSDTELTFSYTVRAGDVDDDGVSIAANELRLASGATIKDANGLSVASTDGVVSHPAVPNQSRHKVDAVAPSVESLAITSNPASGDAYLIDEMIEVTVTFSEDISTDGSPMLGIMVGAGTRNATCAQGGARTELMCSYTVVANDFDADGVSVNADSLSGAITDMPGNAATLTHDAIADDPAHKVYAAAPEAVRSIAGLSMAAGGATNSLDLAGIFTGFQLEYSASSDNESVAVASVSGSELTVRSGMEGMATVTVTATNLAGSASTSFGVIVATDPVEKAVLNDALAAIGRSMLSSTASVIGSRFELAATGSSQMSLAGSRFGGSLSPDMQRLMAGGDPFAMQDRLDERALFGGSGGMQGHGGGYGLTSDRLLSGTAFNMPLSSVGTGGTSFAIWGAGDLASFEGEPDDGMYDGSASSGFIGVDARGDGWLAGVSVSRSGAEADYDFDGLVQGDTGGTLETSVTAFHPYARLEVGADSEIWVIGGFGGGEADLSRRHVAGAQQSDLSMAMAVGGLRRALAMEFGGADLSLRGDAGFLSLETDSGMMAIDGLSASVSRLRLGLEAAWEGESATPFVEVSGRFDGGDGQTGGGLELAGGIRILSAESGFGLEAKGRVLAMHTGEGYSESGIGVTASFEPGAGGRGITFRLSPRWGGSADSTDLFWDEVGNVSDPAGYAYGLDRAQTWGVDAALGYGFGLRSMPGVVTPFGQMDVTGDQDQRLRVGVRYGLMQGLLGGTQLEVSAERVDGEMYRVGETRVLVSGRARF